MKNESGIEATLDSGGKIGELTVWVDGELLEKKGLFKFPDKTKILAAVEQKLRERV